MLESLYIALRSFQTYTMDLSVILRGIASILLITIFSSTVQVAQDNTSQLVASMYSKLTASSLNGSINNLLMQCNWERSAQDVYFRSCFEALMRVPQVTDQMTLARCERG